MSITDFERKPKMLEYVLLAVLLLAALFIVIAVIFQKSADEGLSSTIAGGSETFLGREKKGGADKAWFKWTVIAAIVFGVTVVAAYVIQPDYTYSNAVDYWKNLGEWGSLFN